MCFERGVEESAVVAKGRRRSERWSQLSKRDDRDGHDQVRGRETGMTRMRRPKKLTGNGDIGIKQQLAGCGAGK